ncbi:hypothetical protein Dda_9301 [Drechslerella dactyloides]|uniref:Uncharacterized protein n=1 Tax=Drechslerella dactyloides TaxID=74499 RepID=A0AAD6IPR7_DREDA|nr:hypothetical protein Dda_9301 [Drechslerella dactyloides]
MFSFTKVLLIGVIAAGVTAQDTTTTTPTTCTGGYSASACPTVYDPCCAYICAEAQVPFLVCLPTSQTVLAQCTACPTADVTTTTTTGTETSTDTATDLGSSTSTTTLTSTTTTCTGAPTGNVTPPLPIPTYISGASSFFALGSAAVLGLICMMLAL